MSSLLSRSGLARCPGDRRTNDRYGLKNRHLGKHKRSAERRRPVVPGEAGSTIGVRARNSISTLPACRGDGSRVRTGLTAGGEWIRTSSSAPNGQRLQGFACAAIRRGCAASRQGWPYRYGGPRQIPDFSVGRRDGLVGQQNRDFWCARELEVTGGS
jgi:hypothetical protein